ncbi:MAG: Fur family transcriptional regulator [Eubacteriales bacterium]
MTYEQPKNIKRRNTVQKKLILDTLKRLNCHASAGMVFRALQETNPEIGRATVFRVLSAMAEDGKLRRLKFTNDDDRFDITLFPHSHIICRRCGRVEDVWFDENPALTEHMTDTAGFQVEEITIEFRGLCKSCRENSDIR